MTKPDPNSPDSGAHQDDAVWLDLVARLEGTDLQDGIDPTAGPVRQDTKSGIEGAGIEGAGSEGAGSEGAGSEGAGGSDDAVSAPRAFRDFDPLGLTAPAPVEPSARERSSPAAGPNDSGGIEGLDSSMGPRDYVADDDDDGDFVPEVPPSLAGADPMMVLAWLGAVGGPLALVLSAMFWRAAPVVAILGMVAVFAASVVFLIMKLPGEKDEHDDGARV